MRCDRRKIGAREKMSDKPGTQPSDLLVTIEWIRTGGTRCLGSILQVPKLAVNPNDTQNSLLVEPFGIDYGAHYLDFSVGQCAYSDHGLRPSGRSRG